MGGGEVVRVHGGHIIRSTSGKKDRHSKVYTAKGARDRRVRLAAHTAIQFYDVQDRLGYDRPSKAVDWLMEKAKDAIDKLDRLPPFNPDAVNGSDFQVTDHAPVMGFDSGYPHRDLCLSLQSFQNGAGFEPESGFPVVWSSEINTPADMGRFSRLLTGSEVDSGFHSQPSIQAWDDLPMGPTQHHQFMGFCPPAQIDGDNGEEVDRMMVAAGHHHHGASSLSTTTDSSH